MPAEPPLPASEPLQKRRALADRIPDLREDVGAVAELHPPAQGRDQRLLRRSVELGDHGGRFPIGSCDGAPNREQGQSRGRVSEHHSDWMFIPPHVGSMASRGEFLFEAASRLAADADGGAPQDWDFTSCRSRTSSCGSSGPSGQRGGRGRRRQRRLHRGAARLGGGPLASSRSILTRAELLS